MQAEKLKVNNINAISPDLLLTENRSKKAELRLNNWYKAKEQHKLTAVWSCDDARIVETIALGTSNILPIKTIASAGKSEAFKYIINHRGISQGIVLGHFDSELQQVDRPLLGCGGLGVKAKRLNEIPTHEEFVASHFVDHVIESHDPVYQTLKTGLKLAKQSENGKPVLAALLDHATYQIIPVGYFSNQAKEYIGIVPFDQINTAHQMQVTPDQIKSMDLERLPKTIKALLANNNKLIQSWETDRHQLDEFKYSQKTQNPPLVMITTSVAPIAVRYPGLGIPNQVFTITLPYIKSGDPLSDSGRSLELDENEIKKVIAQTNYPLSHSVVATHDENFYSTKTVLIETPSLQTSLSIAYWLNKQVWFQEWKEKKQGNIIIAQVHSGKTINPTEFFNLK